ncbi:MAG: hypothetical protein JXB50_14890 [Spirochaetes bacterium]|nr:hypothetical protein [Spirochaetota bacterium]
MKLKFLFIVLIIFNINIYGEILSGNKSLIIRNTSILPIINLSKNKSYDYLASLLHYNLKNNLGSQFNIIETNLSEADTFEPTKDTAGKYSIQFNADLVIYGTINIINDIITVNIKTYDAIKDSVTENTEFRYNAKNDLNFLLKKISEKYCSAIIEKFSSYDVELLSIISNRSKLDNQKKTLIQNLLKINKNSYWTYLIQENKKLITIPFLKNSVIFVCDDISDYAVETENLTNDDDSNVKIFVFDDNPGEVRKFKIHLKDNSPILYEYKQKYNYEIDIKYIKIPLENIIKNYRFFIDNSIIGSTSGIFSYELKFGIGVPFNSKLDNNFYIKLLYGIKAINISRTENEKNEYEENLEGANYKFRISFGFEHIFYFKNFLGVQVGIDSGFEYFIFYIMITQDKIINYTKPFTGYPCITISSPFSLHLFTYFRINLIIGIEPTLRFAMSYFNNGEYWNKYIDEARGYGMELFRIRADEFLTVDLFFYDMPIYVSMRIKF